MITPLIVIIRGAGSGGNGTTVRINNLKLHVKFIFPRLIIMFRVPYIVDSFNNNITIEAIHSTALTVQFNNLIIMPAT
jgi:hypothetical protein